MRHLKIIDMPAAKRTPSGVLRERNSRERIPFCAKT
jgi:hypothetical protein